MSFSFEILAAHGRPCPYCHQTMRVPGRKQKHSSKPAFPTRDHVIPKSVMPAMGYIVVCRQCNGDKGNMRLREWRDKLVAGNDKRAKIVTEFMRGNADMALSLKDWLDVTATTGNEKAPLSP